MKKREFVPNVECVDNAGKIKIMKKPEPYKLIFTTGLKKPVTQEQKEYNRGLKKMEQYYQWYISKYYVRKEDLPDEEGWFEICYAVIRMSEFCEDWDGFTEQKALDLASSLAKQIAKRMREEVIQ